MDEDVDEYSKRFVDLKGSTCGVMQEQSLVLRSVRN
jgi:hypothetical protein